MPISSNKSCAAGAASDESGNSGCDAQSCDHFRQAGVTPQLSLIYLLLRSRNFIFGSSVMNSTIPANLFELNTRFETWRANRKYVREPIPDELWAAAADHNRRYPTSRVGRDFLYQRRRRFY